MQIGTEHYFHVALERIQQAGLIYRAGNSYALSMYRSLFMDLVERVKHILHGAVAIEDIKLEDDGGVIGYIVSNDFHGLEFVDRQMKIHKALRSGPKALTSAETRRVAAIAALTPDEFLVWSA